MDTTRKSHVENAIHGLVKILTTPNDPATEALRPSTAESVRRLADEFPPLKRIALLEDLQDRYTEAQSDLRVGVKPVDSLAGLALALVALGGN